LRKFREKNGWPQRMGRDIQKGGKKQEREKAARKYSRRDSCRDEGKRVSGGGGDRQKDWGNRLERAVGRDGREFLKKRPLSGKL